MTDPLHLYRARCGPRNGNAGDDVGLDLVAHFSGRPAETGGPDTCDLVAIGSVLHHLPPWFRGAIWGAGAMGVDAQHGDRFVALPFARTCAVRGKITASRWPGLGDVAFGDPGLLVGDLPAVRALPRAKRYRVGAVPHYVDVDVDELVVWADLHRDEVTVLDVCQRPLDLLRAMLECEHILSSSLHGLVFADALGIPNDWIRLSDKLAGGDFKFHDYFSAFGMPARPRAFHRATPVDEPLARAGEYHRPGLEAVKAGLRQAFPFPRMAP